ncbi:hypothetical protein ADUPG1_005281, partial [Aduncisulcus paluster]
GPAEYNDIIEIYQTGIVQQIIEIPVHYPLKIRRSRLQPERDSAPDDSHFSGPALQTGMLLEGLQKHQIYEVEEIGHV